MWYENFNVFVIFVVVDKIICRKVDVHINESLPHYPCTCLPSFWRCPRNLFPSKGFNHSVVSSLRIDPSKMALTALTSKYIYKMFYNLHMLWMCIWMSPFHVKTTLLRQAFWRLPKLLVHYWIQTAAAALCGGWGYRPIQEGSRINANHIQGASQSSCAVDVHIK